MSEMTFRCGHPREPSNFASRSDGGVRCAKCRRDQHERRRRAQGVQPRQPAVVSAYDPHKTTETLVAAVMTHGSQRLLKALWRSHPTILEHFAAQGRAVKP